jgi:3-phosphoshikimate 1-carboxyvinyltransferase
MTQLIHPGKRIGTITVPPSKSDAQRAILAASLVPEGHSVIQNCGESADVKSIIESVRLLGAQVSGDFTSLIIHGISALPAKCQLNVGESGLAFRMLAGVLASADGDFTLKGSGSLENRTHEFVVEALKTCGAKVASTNHRLPLLISGKFKSGVFTIDGSQSSQHITGLLMGYASAKLPVELHISDIKSSPYLEMTQDTLKRFGVEMTFENDTFILDGTSTFHATHYSVEGDWSGASYPLVAAALGHEIVTKGLSMNSKQADKQLVHFLINSGCQVTATSDGMYVNGANRTPMIADLTDCPDLFPAAVAYAASTLGLSRLKGVHRLRNKESDRARALKIEYAKLGVDISIDGDELVVNGVEKILAGRVDAHGDHRIAMALAVTALNAEKSVELNGAEHVGKSFPDFWDQWNALNLIVN